MLCKMFKYHGSAGKFSNQTDLYTATKIQRFLGFYFQSKLSALENSLIARIAHNGK